MHRPALLAATLFTAGLIAQDCAPTQAPGLAIPPLRAPIHTAAADLGHAYGLWAAGDSYKVGFADGATFVPYLGRGYPHNQPFRWHTTSIRVGSEELAHGEARPHTSEYRYELRRDAVIEAYDVLVGGLEQTFVLPTRPAATGDLVIRGAIETLLHATHAGGGHQTLVFADDAGREIVGYGAATAIDRAGHHMTMTSRVEGNEIVLRLAAEQLATAAFPLVVDPMLTKIFVENGLGAIDSLDIGRDDEGATSNVMIVYERAASISDGDLYARLMNDDYSAPNVVFDDLTASWDTSGARCAYVGGAHKWALVFGRRFPTAPVQTQVRSHVRASGDTTFATTYASLVPPGNHNDWRADVGGVESYSLGTHALVVFQRENNTGTSGNFANTPSSDLAASLLDVTTTNGTFGASFPVLGDTQLDYERPTVNQVAPGGAAFSWMLACQVYNPAIALDDWDIWCKRIDNAGNVSGATWLTDVTTATAAQHQLGPIVEGRDGRYLVAWNGVDTATVPGSTVSVAGKEVRVQRFDWAHGAAMPTSPWPSVVLEQNNDRHWEITGLAADTRTDSHWAVAYRGVLTTPGAFFGAHIARVGYRGQPTESAPLSFATSPLGHVAATFDNDHGDVLCAYGQFNVVHSVYGHTLTQTIAAPITTSGTTCSTALLSWTGSQQIGSEFCGPNSDGAPANTLHLMFVSLATVDVPVLDPIVYTGCRLLVDIAAPDYLGAFPLAIGSDVSWQLSLPEFLPATTLHFQDWQLQAADGLFHATHRLSVPIVK